MNFIIIPILIIYPYQTGYLWAAILGWWEETRLWFLGGKGTAIPDGEGEAIRPVLNNMWGR